jgi:tetratricopeptide (TPR) repeat protein
MNRFTEKAEKVLGGGAEKVRALVRNRLLAWVARNRISPCFRLLEFLADLGGIPRNDELILQSITADLANGTDERLTRAYSSGLLEKIAGPERIAALVHIIKTKQALLRGGEEDIRNVFLEPPPEPYAPYKVQILTSLAGFQLGIRDAASAMETVKEAILLSQDRPWAGLAQAYRLFSLVNLVRQQVNETIDYAAFAVENAEKTGSHDELAIALYYSAAAQFLYGNLSKAGRLACEAEKQAERMGRPEWADKALFLRGRFRFEAGHYRDALDIFESIRKKENASPEKKRLIDAWIYRVKVYSQSPLIQKPEDGGRDADLFEIEAAYLAENFRRTAELCGRFQAPEERFIFTEQPDWRSGFAQCELFLLSPPDFWNRIVSVYHSLALCKISPSGAEEAVRTMQRILREEGLSDMDPNDAFYLYAFYRILHDSGSPQVDMNTAVSMAFKRLQRRASRIDDIEVRRDFLSLPRWNNALSLAARDYKLI